MKTVRIMWADPAIVDSVLSNVERVEDMEREILLYSERETVWRIVRADRVAMVTIKDESGGDRTFDTEDYSTARKEAQDFLREVGMARDEMIPPKTVERYLMDMILRQRAK